MPNVTSDDFRLTLSPVFLRPLSLIYFFLAVGALVMLGIFLAIILTFNTPTPSEDDDSLISMLTVAVLLVMVALIPVSSMLFKNLLVGGGALSSPDDALRRIRTAYIVRLAVLEGAALFGLVVFLLAGLWGVLHTSAVYWANLLPWVFFLAFLALTFPTRARIEEVFRSRLRSLG